MRLIDVDAVLKGKKDHTYISTHELWNAPTVDAEPIRHGRWIFTMGWVCCSECGNEPPSESNVESNYCPNCGAKMDGATVKASDTYSVTTSEGECIYECYHCREKKVVWDNDFSFEDCGLKGNGIVHMYHCENCGAMIEVKMDLGENDE